jgi:hypothetical protein
MIWTLWIRKAIVLIAAILTLACTAVFFTPKVTHPEALVNSVLTQWHCTKTAGIITVCTKKPGSAKADLSTATMATELSSR